MKSGPVPSRLRSANLALSCLRSRGELAAFHPSQRRDMMPTGPTPPSPSGGRCAGATPSAPHRPACGGGGGSGGGQSAPRPERGRPDALKMPSLSAARATQQPARRKVFLSTSQTRTAATAVRFSAPAAGAKPVPRLPQDKGTAFKCRATNACGCLRPSELA